MRFILILLSITLGLVTLNQANSDKVSVASIQQTPPTGTYFDHLVFIIMENAGMSNICGSGNNPPPCNGPDNPYMSGLANSYGLATRYVDLQGTSQPNYIGIMAATLNGCTSSCAPNSLSETNLVDRFEAAGLSWKAYMEDQTPVAGCDNSNHGFYEIAHNPFVAFSSIDSNASRCNKIALANPANNFTCTGTDCALVKDLNSGSAPNFMWVTPNDCNNAHGATGCANGCLSSYTSPCEKAGDNYTYKSIAAAAPRISSIKISYATTLTNVEPEAVVACNDFTCDNREALKDKAQFVPFRASDDAQPLPCVHQLAGHRCPASSDQRVRLPDRLKQILPLEAGAVIEIHVGRGAQNLQSRLSQSVGDQDAMLRHARATSSSASSIVSSEATGISPMCPMRKVVAFHCP